MGDMLNTAAHIIPNHWEPLGIKYITYCWNDDESQIILDPKHNTIHYIYILQEEVLSKGESILIHSERRIPINHSHSGIPNEDVKLTKSD